MPDDTTSPASLLTTQEIVSELFSRYPEGLLLAFAQKPRSDHGYNLGHYYCNNRHAAVGLATEFLQVQKNMLNDTRDDDDEN